MAKTSCRTAATSIYISKGRTAALRMPAILASARLHPAIREWRLPTAIQDNNLTAAISATGRAGRQTPDRKIQEPPHDESVAVIHSSTRRNIAADVRRAAGGNCCLPAVAR